MLYRSGASLLKRESDYYFNHPVCGSTLDLNVDMAQPHNINSRMQPGVKFMGNTALKKAERELKSRFDEHRRQLNGSSEVQTKTEAFRGQWHRANCYEGAIHNATEGNMNARATSLHPLAHFGMAGVLYPHVESCCQSKTANGATKKSTQQRQNASLSISGNKQQQKETQFLRHDSATVHSVPDSVADTPVERAGAGRVPLIPKKTFPQQSQSFAPTISKRPSSHELVLAAMDRQLEELGVLKTLDGIHLTPDRSVFCGWKVVSLLGSGTFASVYKLEHLRTGETVAAKLLEPQKFSCSTQRRVVEMFAKEIRYSVDCQCPGVVQLKKVLRGTEGWMIIQEIIEGGTLWEDFETDDELDRFGLFLQLLQSVMLMQERQVVHRDLKPTNILRTADRKRLLITDFGWSETYDDLNLYTHELPGTIEINPPEVLAHKSGQSEKIDNYALAMNMMLLYSRQFVCRDKCLSTADAAKKVLSRIANIQASRPLPGFTNDSWEVFLGLSHFNSEKRFSLSAVIESKWFLSMLARLIDAFPRSESLLLFDGLSIVNHNTNNEVLNKESRNAPIWHWPLRVLAAQFWRTRYRFVPHRAMRIPTGDSDSPFLEFNQHNGSAVNNPRITGKAPRHNPVIISPRGGDADSVLSSTCSSTSLLSSAASSLSQFIERRKSCNENRSERNGSPAHTSELHRIHIRPAHTLEVLESQDSLKTPPVLLSHTLLSSHTAREKSFSVDEYANCHSSELSRTVGELAETKRDVTVDRERAIHQSNVNKPMQQQSKTRHISTTVSTTGSLDSLASCCFNIKLKEDSSVSSGGESCYSHRSKDVPEGKRQSIMFCNGTATTTTSASCSASCSSSSSSSSIGVCSRNYYHYQITAGSPRKNQNNTGNVNFCPRTSPCTNESPSVISSKNNCFTASLNLKGSNFADSNHLGEPLERQRSSNYDNMTTITSTALSSSSQLSPDAAADDTTTRKSSSSSFSSMNRCSQKDKHNVQEVYCVSPIKNLFPLRRCRQSLVTEGGIPTTQDYDNDSQCFPKASINDKKSHTAASATSVPLIQYSLLSSSTKQNYKPTSFLNMNSDQDYTYQRSLYSPNPKLICHDNNFNSRFSHQNVSSTIFNGKMALHLPTDIIFNGLNDQLPTKASI